MPPAYVNSAAEFCGTKGFYCDSLSELRRVFEMMWESGHAFLYPPWPAHGLNPGELFADVAHRPLPENEVYAGEMKDGKRWGFGTLLLPEMKTRTLSTSEFENDMMNGIFFATFGNAWAFGDVENNVMSGRLIMSYPGG